MIIVAKWVGDELVTNTGEVLVRIERWSNGRLVPVPLPNNYRHSGHRKTKKGVRRLAERMFGGHKIIGE
jgi:hypothetical protein